MSKKNYARDIALAGCFAAIVFVLTYLVKIPSPFARGAYYHAGDIAVLLSGTILGPVLGPVTAAIGSGLADLLLGYAFYIPATVIIKAVMALITAVMLKREENNNIIKQIGVLLIAILFMVVGYSVYEIFILKTITIEASVPNMLFNLAQGAVGGIGYIILNPIIKNATKNFN